MKTIKTLFNNKMTCRVTSMSLKQLIKHFENVFHLKPARGPHSRPFSGSPPLHPHLLQFPSPFISFLVRLREYNDKTFLNTKLHMNYFFSRLRCSPRPEKIVYVWSSNFQRQSSAFWPHAAIGRSLERQSMEDSSTA